MPPLTTVDHFLPLSLPAQIAFYVENKLSPRFGVEDDGSKAIIRANRQRLRRWLSTNIPVQFLKVASHLEEGPDRVTVHFKDGTSATGDIVVGADGVHSIVRHHLLGDSTPPQVLPLAVVIGETTLAGREFERQLELGYSAYVAMDTSGPADGGILFVGLNSVGDDGKSGNYYWFLSYKDEAATVQPHWTASASKDQLFELALKKSSHLNARFQELIKLTGVGGISKSNLAFRDLELSSLPVGKITLLGDAAHCMTPCKCSP